VCLTTKPLESIRRANIASTNTNSMTINEIHKAWFPFDPPKFQTSLAYYGLLRRTFVPDIFSVAWLANRQLNNVNLNRRVLLSRLKYPVKNAFEFSQRVATTSNVRLRGQLERKGTLWNLRAKCISLPRFLLNHLQARVW
jgi:hypothetical protein